MWDLFKHHFFHAINKHFPKRERRIKVDCEKWINDSILSKMRQRDFLHLKALKSKSDEDWKAYKAARKRVGEHIHEAKREFVYESINPRHASPKNMWKRIKEFLPSIRTQTNLHTWKSTENQLPVLPILQTNSTTFSHIWVIYLLRNLVTLYQL